MSLWQILFAMAVAISQAIVAGIQFVDADSFGTEPIGHEVAGVIVGHRLGFTIVCSLVAGVGVLVTVLFKPRKTRKRYRESLVDGIFEQVLDNDRNTGRITLFTDVGLLRRWWYRVKDFVYLKRRRSKTIKEAWTYCWNANYIRIWDRWGTEHRNSKTYFCVNHQTAALCQGVAGQVRQREVAVTVALPRIEGLDLKAEPCDQRVTDYMNQGHISDINVLRMINRPAPYIYGAIISTNGGSRKYVLVVDSWAESDPFLSRRVKKTVLPAYIKQISAVLDTRS